MGEGHLVAAILAPLLDSVPELRLVVIVFCSRGVTTTVTSQSSAGPDLGRWYNTILVLLTAGEQ